MEGQQITLYNSKEPLKKYRNTGSNAKLMLQLRGLEMISCTLKCVNRAIDRAISANKYNTYVIVNLKQIGDDIEGINDRLEYLKIFLKKGVDKYYAGD